MIKYSKSNLIICLSDNKLRDNRIKYILQHGRNGIPLSMIFRNSEEKEKWRGYVKENKCILFYKEFDIKRRLMEYGIVEIKKIIDKIECEKNEFEQKIEILCEEEKSSIAYRIFLMSCMIYKFKDIKMEMRLLLELEKYYRNHKRDFIVRNILIKIGKYGVLRYIQSRIIEYEKCYEFLELISDFLDQDILELWFEERLPLPKKLFGKLKRIKISDGIPIISEMFDYCMRYNNFVNNIINQWINEELVIKLVNYTNRGDYKYFNNMIKNNKVDCNKLIIKDKISILNIKDNSDNNYKYMDFFNNEIKMENKIYGIVRYEKEVGYNVVLNMFIDANFEKCIECLLKNEIGTNIIKKMILFNNLVKKKNERIFKRTRCLNEQIWKKLRNDENKMRIYGLLFDIEIEPILHNLLNKKYKNIDIILAEQYIGFGYEEELKNYFKKVKIENLEKIINDWNRLFIFEVMYEKISSEYKERIEDIEKVLDIVSFNISEKMLPIIAKILDMVFSIKSNKIYNKLGKALKFIYVGRHISFIIQFLNENEESIEKASLQDISNILELSKLMNNYNSEIFNNRINYIIKYIDNIITCEDKLKYNLINKNDNKINNNTVIKIDNENLKNILILNKEKLINRLFEISYINKEIFKYYFVEFFDELTEFVNNNFTKEDIKILTKDLNLIDEPIGYHINRIEFYLRFAPQNFLFKNLINKLSYIQNNFIFYTHDLISMIFKIGFIFSQNLSNKYTLFILFDKLLNIFNSENIFMKAILLRFIHPCFIPETFLFKLLQPIISLINSPNIHLSDLAKDFLSKVCIETAEMQALLPLVFQSFLRNDSFLSFIITLRSCVFNNYLCTNSINLLLLLLFRRIDEFTDDILYIITRLPPIIKDKDMHFIAPSLLVRLHKLVLKNNFIVDSVLLAAEQYVSYSNLDTYNILYSQIGNVQIAYYFIQLLKFSSNYQLNTEILNDIVTNHLKETDFYFIAYACQLSEFDNHIRHFIPLLQKNFLSTDTSKQTMAVKAFKYILLRYNNNNNQRDKLNYNSKIISSNFMEKYNKNIKNTEINNFEDIKHFVTFNTIIGESHVRLSALPLITDNLALLYIFRNDSHPIIKKTAIDMWKSSVVNSNITLSFIYEEILNYARYMHYPLFKEPLCATISEIAKKYTIYIEKYIASTTQKWDIISESKIADLLEIKELIILESCKVRKLQTNAFDFCFVNNSPSVFNMIYNIENNNLFKKMSKERLFYYARYNVHLALILFQETRDLSLLIYLGNDEKLKFLKDISENQNNLNNNIISDNNNFFIHIINSIDSSKKSEEFFISTIPLFTFYYISILRQDFGLLTELFIKVSNTSLRINSLISQENISYLKYCSFETITDYSLLLKYLFEENDKKSFERIIEIFFSNNVPINLSTDLTAYFLKNYLMNNRKDQSFFILKKINKKYSNLGYFKIIIENSILNN